MGRPIKGKHAIDTVVFAVTYQHPFSKKSIDSLMTLENSLKESYPSFTKGNRIDFNIDNSGVTQHSSTISGILLQQGNEKGQILWSLRAEENAISITCTDYDRWESTSKRAKNDLLVAANALERDNNFIDSIGLQVIDRFIEESEKYDLKNIFNKKSRYFSKQLLTAGKLWHIHQGWFEDTEDGKKKHLNVLNLSTKISPSGQKIITSIDHISKIDFTLLDNEKEIVTIESLNEVFEFFHGNNKKILDDLLNAKQKRGIKLWE